MLFSLPFPSPSWSKDKWRRLNKWMNERICDSWEILCYIYWYFSFSHLFVLCLKMQNMKKKNIFIKHRNSTTSSMCLLYLLRVPEALYEVVYGVFDVCQRLPSVKFDEKFECGWWAFFGVLQFRKKKLIWLYVRLVKTLSMHSFAGKGKEARSLVLERIPWILYSPGQILDLPGCQWKDYGQFSTVWPCLLLATRSVEYLLQW